MDWRKKTTWIKDDNGTYRVEVVHHTTQPSGDPEPVNHWAVYAFIYPRHPLFARFTGKEMWQAATSALPGHSYCSYLEKHTDDDGRVCSWQVGWDYGHDGDEQYANLSADQPHVVMYDAGQIIATLEEMKPEATPPAAAKGEG